MIADHGSIPMHLPSQTPEQAARLRAIVERKGTLGNSSVEQLWGAGKDLWADDAEFEAFLESIREIRSQKD